MQNTDVLDKLAFTDLYLGQKTIHPDVPDQYRDALDEIRTRCEELSEKQNRSEFSLEVNKVFYRVSTLQSLNEKVYVIRKPHKEYRLRDLNIPAMYLNLMLTPDVQGLLVIAGAYGEGKTTTGLCLVRERVEIFSHTAITIEDPPELRIEGAHGKGYCYQTDVRQGEFAQACRSVARQAPDIIYLSEIRDAETASEALRASINGRLVICTTHAENVTQALERLFSLANKQDNSDDAASLLANGLLGVVYQKLESQGDDLKLPKIDMLWLGGNDPQIKGVRSNLRDKRWSGVNDYISLCKNRMLMGDS